MLATCQVFNKCLCPDTRPSPIFLLFSVLLNSVSLTYAVIGLNAEKDGIGGNPDTWLAVMAGITGVNVLFAVYLYYRFNTLTFGGESVNERMSPWNAAVQLLMYDIGVFLYILILIFILIWSFIMSNFECKVACDDKHDAMSNSRTAQFLYVFLGCFVVAFSLFTQCCKEPRHQRVTVVTYGNSGQQSNSSGQTLQQNASRVGTAVGAAMGKGVGAMKGVLGSSQAASQPPPNYQTHQPAPLQYQHQQPQYTQQQWSAPAPAPTPPAPTPPAPTPPAPTPPAPTPPAPTPPAPAPVLQPQCTPAEYPPAAVNQYSAPAPSAPPANEQPPQQQTASEKVGTAVGSALGKGLGALKGLTKK